MNRAATAVEAGYAVVGGTLRSWQSAWTATNRALAERYFDAQAKSRRAGVFARAWTIRTIALWIAVLLTGYVLVYLR